jgi:hypothetical protein
MSDHPPSEKAEDDLPHIEELSEESPEDVLELEQEYRETQEKLILKTTRIEVLKSSMLSPQAVGEIAEDLEPEFEDFEEELLAKELESVEEVEEEEVKEEPPTVQSKIREKIKALTHRCESGLGNSMFQRAYVYLQTAKAGQEELRTALIEIVGETNIGYWAILDQLVFLEQYLANTADS